MATDYFTDSWHDIWPEGLTPPKPLASWSARLRTPDLKITKAVGFSAATCVENYLQPGMLSITGRLDNIRETCQPGYGIVLRDTTGKVRFSGKAVDITVREGGTAEVVFASDMAKLWYRLIYPNPTINWDSQTTESNEQTGSAEDRILAYIDDNAGPSAWHEAVPGSDPGGGAAFAVHGVTITPTVDHHSAQNVVPDPGSTDLYMAQPDADGDPATPDDLRISRFTAAGTYVSSMTFPRGGHGDQIMVTRREDKVFISFRYRGASMSHATGGTWVCLPYTAGKAWTAAKALAYKVDPPKLYVPGQPLSTSTPPKSALARNAWTQGEIFYNGKFYRMYGTPYDNAGSMVIPAIPAYIQVIENGVVTDTLDLAAAGLGRIGMNPAANPIAGVMEPQGLALINNAGQWSLLIGYAVNVAGARQSVRYTYPLDPGTGTVQDRRVYGLTIPSSAGRGLAGVTTARPPDSVGQVVAALAEKSDLRVDIVQDDTLPQLNVVITDAPDMTDSIRIGTPEAGGPVMLGPDWFFRSAMHTTTTVLSVAGGELGEDDVMGPLIFNTLNDDVRIGDWNERIETYVDQHGSTETVDIAEGMKDAMLEGIGPTEVAAPLGQSALEFGTDVPLGAKVSAFLAGKQIVERIRQITTELSNAEGSPAVKTTAILGDSEAGITLTQKDIRRMDRRLQRLERI
jgi:hypothetical protein